MNSGKVVLHVNVRSLTFSSCFGTFSEPDAAVEEAWGSGIDRRLAELESGRVQGIPVEDVMARYVWTVDSLDADGYVGVFTEDAVIDSNGSISRGHAEIRKIVTGLIQRRDENKAVGSVEKGWTRIQPLMPKAPRMRPTSIASSGKAG